jgi:hypothetical protein
VAHQCLEGLDVCGPDAIQPLGPKKGNDVAREHLSLAGHGAGFVVVLAVGQEAIDELI